MNHTYYAPIPPKRVEWKENLKAVGLAVSIGVGAAAFLFFQLS